jgi:hypothetical protein
LPKNAQPETPEVTPAENPAVAPEVTPAEAPAAPAIVNAETKIETNTDVVRQPFAGTKVETFDQVQVKVQGEAKYEDVEIRPGVTERRYIGVQPGVVLMDAAGKEIAA